MSVRAAVVSLSLLSLLSLLLVVACDRQVAGGSTDGAAVFRAACASCHGEHGKPPQAMAAQLGVRDLTGAEFRGRRSKELVKHQVVTGSANARMPSFKGALTDAQIDAVAAYVLTLEP
ncbi:MAG TPA: c-type cytochrome [Kofleriaceae bacterium]|nr:c-type cytochrome [Kofleriaceae bacterium]